MISKETIYRIKEAAAVADVVSGYLSLRKRGVNFVGICPFHNDSHPSLYVSPQKGLWKCFACGEGGNAVDFVMRMEQTDYPGALRLLAARYGIPVEERQLTDRQRAENDGRERLRCEVAQAAEVYAALLAAEGCPARAYLQERGITEETARKFGIGYDDGSRDARSPFRDRVVFPWHGVSGQVVGFGARLLDPRTKGVSAKYVNSADSVLFHKERELYGLFQAKRAIMREGNVYVVEGYLDVLQFSGRGIGNVVATGGTALSAHQAQLIRRMTGKATVIYDSDTAGEAATRKACDQLLMAGVEARVVRLPEGEDPDSFALSHDLDALRAYLQEHDEDFIRYVIRKAREAGFQEVGDKVAATKLVLDSIR